MQTTGGVFMGIGGAGIISGGGLLIAGRQARGVDQLPQTAFGGIILGIGAGHALIGTILLAVGSARKARLTLARRSIAGDDARPRHARSCVPPLKGGS
jgi:hypothetical protein